MKYIIMCAGKYKYWETPKQLIRINNEPIVVRTTRLLIENGVNRKDIGVTCSAETAPEFMRYCDCVITSKSNTFTVRSAADVDGYWCDCFYKMNEPCTYLMGDVIFSPQAIKTIVETPTTDIEFFASAPPFDKRYSKEWAEPFAFKVVDYEHLRQAQEKTKELADAKKFNRVPIAWEFWQVVKNTPINEIDYTNYTVINDYTCDIDTLADIKNFEGVV